MPITLTVSEVCDVLYKSAGSEALQGPGAPSTRMLGQWFHEGIKRLVQSGAGKRFTTLLAESGADLSLWKQTLKVEIYQQFVGPKITRQQAVLRDLTPQVLSFWDAMQSACDWIAELCWSLRTQQSSPRSMPRLPWTTLEEWFSTEEALECVLREPGWTDSVRLVGVADAVVRLAETGNWCALEFKLGRTFPAVDLGQACLYHLMLTDAEQARQKETYLARPVDDLGALSLISFHPNRHEQLFTTSQLAETRERLIDLIGSIANVKSSVNSSAKADTLAGSSASHPSNSAQLPSPLASLEVMKPADMSGMPNSERLVDEKHRDIGKSIVKICEEFGVKISLEDQVDVGPAFLRFSIKLGRGTKVAAVKRLAEDLHVRLGLKAAPFISMHEGRLVIDVQRPDPCQVTFDEVRSQLATRNSERGGSQVPIGVDLSNRLIFADLSKPDHCHMLVAGTTGSGKSEWLRLAIAGLIMTNTPDTLRLLVIDPKRNAFYMLRESPYLWRPLVFPDERSVVDVLSELAEEMDRRYQRFQGADNFDRMVAQSEVPLPRIVCVCDEYRDLISRDRKERKLIEAQVCRLGAKARAAGIHLILATQEASRDTIKGPLDSNMPVRVGLKMGKAVESRMLFGESGAENLLGHGDLLFKDIGRPRRLQAPLLSDKNRDEIFSKSNAAEKGD